MKDDKHLCREEFITKINAFRNYKEVTIKNYERIYEKITRRWDKPSEWYKDGNSFVGNCRSIENAYWCIWSLTNREKLPPQYVSSINHISAQKILRYTLSDYGLLDETICKMKSEYGESYVHCLFSIVVLACVYSGINSVKELDFQQIIRFDKEIAHGYNSKAYQLLNLKYYMGYENKTAHDQLFKLKKAQKILSDPKWSPEMINIKERFLSDLENYHINARMKNDKRSHLDYFAEWYIEQNYLDKICDLKLFSRESWLKYIKYLFSINIRSDKTNYGILLTVVQFFEWLKTKEIDVIDFNLCIYKSDFTGHLNYTCSKSLAFDKREYGEKILYYLVNEFKEEDIVKKFMREALIIAANSGMRYSEISNLKLGCCYWSEDEKCYKLTIDYIDKMRQKNRPVYITKLGYEALKRAENLRIECSNLSKRENNKGDEDYIYTFEYRGRKIIYHNGMYQFLNKIKVLLGLVDEQGKPVKGGVHAFRHFFAMTVFRESGYDIGAVRYLLGHRSYVMSNKYLEEEKERVIVKIREKTEVADKEFAGSGVDSILDLIFQRKTSKEFFAVRKLLERSSNLAELINGKIVKKLPIGYCLNPCGNENKCFKCNKYLVETSEKEQLLKFTIDFFELLSFKISLFKSTQEALNEKSIQEEIKDLDILLKELRILGIDNNRIMVQVFKVVN